MKRMLLLGLVVIVALSLWSAAYGNEPSRTISGSSQFTSVTIMPYIADRLVDLDGDGTNDYRIRTGLQMVTSTGLMNGTFTGYFTNTLDLRTLIQRGNTTFTFWGTVGDSEPGTMTTTTNAILDASNPALLKFKSKPVVVAGSGSGGLEGITGLGVVQDEFPPAGPFVLTADMEFRFSNASGTAFLASP